MAAHTEIQSPPRDDLIRENPGVTVSQNGGGPKLVGTIVPFNQWTEINSAYEGHFLERFAPGALTKTFQDRADRIQVLFQHGKDPQVGDKPLGTISRVDHKADGTHYEVDLLDTGYVRELIPGLEAGLYGTSVRFRVLKEEFVKEPGRSDHNPEGLPERTVKEAFVREFGPVTFPAYGAAKAGMRSRTDEWLIDKLAPHIQQHATSDTVASWLAPLIRHELEQRAASGSASWPLNDDRNRAWDAAAADQRIRAWASSDGSGDAATMNWGKYASVHFWRDAGNAEAFGGYKLLFCDVVNGDVQAIWRAVTACAAVMQGGRGGVDMPPADMGGVRSRIGSYYSKASDTFNEELTPPWAGRDDTDPDNPDEQDDPEDTNSEAEQGADEVTPEPTPPPEPAQATPRSTRTFTNPEWEEYLRWKCLT